MKIYFIVVGLIGFLVLMFGFFLPAVVSSDSTEVVMGGIILTLITIPFVIKGVLTIFKKEKK